MAQPNQPFETKLMAQVEGTGTVDPQSARGDEPTFGLSSKKHKVTVVGVGMVGMAAAYAILNQSLASELCLIDVVADKVQAEVDDLKHGAAFLKRVVISGGTDYKVSAGSELVVITAGARQREGETRLNLLQRNAAILGGIVPEVVKYSPDCVILVVSNPVDVLTNLVARIAKLPPGRVFGSGTALDSSRLRTLVSNKLGIDAHSVHCMIIGEHGDSSVACWSAANIAGARLSDMLPLEQLLDKPADLGGDASPAVPTVDDLSKPETWHRMHKDVVRAAYKIITAKGYTNWAIGAAVASISAAVLRDERRVMPVSVPVGGLYGIQGNIYLSLPAVVGAGGVKDIIKLNLHPTEVKQLQASADAIGKAQEGL